MIFLIVTPLIEPLEVQNFIGNLLITYKFRTMKMVQFEKVQRIASIQLSVQKLIFSL